MQHNDSLTVKDLKASAKKLNIAQINETLRPEGVEIGRINGEWFADFLPKHPAFEAGELGTRSFCESMEDAIADALANSAQYLGHGSQRRQA